MGISIVSMLGGFLSNKSGSIGPVFTVALVPLMLCVGAAVDYSEMNRVQSRLQIAGDGAALYAISGYSDGGFDEDDIDDLARKMVLSTYDINTSDVDINLDKTKSTLGISLKTNYNPAFLGIAGYKNITVSVCGCPRFCKDYLN